jgi:uncharacterized RDD family membrane protein YckC
LVDYAPILILDAVTFGNRTVFSILGLLTLGYWILIGHIEGLTGQSPGKAIMGIRLVNAQGQLVGSGAGIGRRFLHVLDLIVCGLGFLLPLVDAKRQTIADKVMSTFVVSGAEKKPFSFDLWVPPKTG